MKQNNSISIRVKASIIDYMVLMKPELTLLSVITSIGGAYLAFGVRTHYYLLFHTFIGTTLIGFACAVLNQYLERNYDAMMKRTAQRPLPAGRVQPIEALILGCVLGISGLAYLAILTNWIAVSLAVLTLIIYLVIYTPLKRVTPFATVVGGVSGALPPLIGWSIVRGSVSMEAWSLFFILFFWQMPHFLSLSWMYRKDYSRAQYKMLSVSDVSGNAVSRQILFYSLALIPASLMPTLVGLSDFLYLIGAMLLSLGFLLMAILFFRQRSYIAARRLFLSSLVFLSLLFFLLMIA